MNYRIPLVLFGMILLWGLGGFFFCRMVLWKMPFGLRIFLFAGWGFYFVYLMFTSGVWFLSKKRKRYPMNANGENILVIAPHQDDCVAMAGGYAIQTIKKGGKVKVLYLTDGPENDKVTRRNEALEAWRMLGLNASDLVFLPYHTLTGFTIPEEIRQCTEDITKWIKTFQPQTIFVPLYEGGHFQHDAANYMVHCAVKRIGFSGEIYEAPLYNFYVSLRTTPEKILSGFLRYVPFVHISYPPEPVQNDSLFELDMSSEEIELKKQMLSCFRTQQPHQLVARFGFPDRYQKFHAYDYTKPPFSYQYSIARIINWLKEVPVIQKLVFQMFKWTRTIHPDPRYTITRIPGGAS